MRRRKQLQRLLQMRKTGNGERDLMIYYKINSYLCSSILRKRLFLPQIQPVWRDKVQIRPLA